MVGFLLWWAKFQLRTRHAALASVLLVRIPRPKIEELVLQAQGVGIFAIGEYPASPPQKTYIYLAPPGSANRTLALVNLIHHSVVPLPQRGML